MFTTFTVYVAFTAVPSFAVAVIVTLPTPFPVTTPVLLTVAMFSLLLIHFTFLLNAFDGVIFAFSVIKDFFNTDVEPETFIDVTGVHSTYLIFFSFAKVFAAEPL